MSHVAPSRDSDAFNCPHCSAYAKQDWWEVRLVRKGFHGYEDVSTNWHGALCDHCEGISLWGETKMVLPVNGSAPPASPDMPSDVRADYEEANSISTLSPKGAAALLRLALQKLLIQLGHTKDINSSIKELVSKGLSLEIQKALDTVRIIGNEAVHPGQIDLDDKPEMVQALFRLLNVIVTRLITEPKEISEMYDLLPESKRNATDKRDGRAMG